MQYKWDYTNSKKISMAQCKTVVTPLLTYWCQHILALQVIIRIIHCVLWDNSPCHYIINPMPSQSSIIHHSMVIIAISITIKPSSPIQGHTISTSSMSLSFRLEYMITVDNPSSSRRHWYALCNIRLALCGLYLIFPWTKWLPFRRQYFEMHFREWKVSYFD